MDGVDRLGDGGPGGVGLLLRVPGAYSAASYSASSRPDNSYFCDDCHGYRYFDPYYDWCANHGFRYAWAAHPKVLGLYRERYVTIREHHPEYGRYRYQPGYRSSPRYREARDYEDWKSGRSSSSEGSRGVREETRGISPQDQEHRIQGRDREESGELSQRRSKRGGQT